MSDITQEFQSLLCKKSKDKDSTRAYTKLVKTIKSELDDDSGSEDIDSDEDISGDESQSLKKSKRDFVCCMFDEMIEWERLAWKHNYFIFYRVVNKKYVLYQFNTLMLHYFHNESRVNSLICTPSLDDSIYPSSLDELFSMFNDKSIRSDSGELTSNILLSVNNCLTPTECGKRVLLHSNLSHEMEASPMQYYKGYDETHSYITEMERFMRLFFEVSAEEATDKVNEMFRLYRNAHARNAGIFKGHCLQIWIPAATLSQFAYPCVSWGNPVKIYAGEHNKLHALPLPEGDQSSISLAELLRRSELGELQSRILAHPNLYLTAGAITRVFHADAGFDENGFVSELKKLLEPLITNAVYQHKHISFTKFC